MLKEVRHEKIIEKLYRDGRVMVNELSILFETSKDTIRRDLSALEDKLVLKRVYGGAVPIQLPIPDYSQRVKTQRDEKYIIAKKALATIREGSFIAMDGGSTATLLASLIPKNMKLDIVTNSHDVAIELRGHPYVNIILIGGNFLKTSNTTVGELAIEQVKRYRFDQCFIGVYALNNSIGLSVPYEDEVGVKAMFIQSSKVVNMICVSDKIGKESRFQVCSLDQITNIYTDNHINHADMKDYNGKIK